ncbi:MAG: PTS sugar transporter subunit IIA [Acidobacteriota bacterium]|nr:PTS sugar transporter subunit IIA [Acidobacteriota bacterium]
MFRVLVLTHGSLADELVSSARTIAGEAPDVTALSLPWEDSLDEARAKVGAALEGLANGDGVLILTDMYGGTPFNVARGFAEPGQVEVVTGVNLPMVVRVTCKAASEPFEDGRETLSEVALWIQGKGQKSICLCTESNLREDGDLEKTSDLPKTPEVESG